MSNGRHGRVITYSNGAIKEIHRDWITVRFPNGDVQTETIHDRAYYYSATGVVQIQYHDRDYVTEYHYPTGQVEEHWTDGSHKITVRYPNGRVQHYIATPTLTTTTKG